MVEQLKKRLEQYKAENEQLEELLSRADAQAAGGSGQISRLEDELARAQAARISAEAATAQALAAKAAEAQSLRQQLDAAASRADAAEGRLEALQDANERFVEERQASESQLLQTLRREMEAIEQRLDEERAAHTATRKASAAREQQLDATLAESSASLASMQRTLEERSAKLGVAEERCYALEHEVEGLTLRLAAAEARVQRQAEAAAASSSEVLQQRVADLEGQLSSAQAAAQVAELARSRADEELVALRAAAGTLKRQLADAAAVDHSDLQRRLKDVTDMLYLKQTQLERLAADKAAQQLAMERDLQMARTEAAAVKRRGAADRHAAGSDADAALVPMERIGDAYQRLANNDRVGGAVKAGAQFIDSTATQFVRILRQYPLGRLVVFAYVIGMHCFIYFLLHRLQHKAFRAELAAAALHRDQRI
ncbi:golgin candidate 1 [Micractinium conductrix]|uniref:Golgin candidate 1 n=1 Tax=Micractinium conductrix TaxID=554055 RepID=A0A2P6VD11_9CHLO|nr:golgin candidate 1 [Micractinium conductrix]|eukprot:PSC71978.1 golgin candidate 1 [Micractinium conductrix]